MHLIDKKILKTLDFLKEYSSTLVGVVSDIKYQETDYKTDNTLPDNNWNDMEILEGADKHYWLYSEFSTPTEDGGYSYYLNVETGAMGWDANNPQGLIYLNGKMMQGLDTNHTRVFLDPSTDYSAHIYLYTASAGQPLRIKMNTVRVHDNTEALYFDMLVPYEALYIYNENTSEYVDTLAVLEKTANIIDFRAPRSKEFYDSVELARQFIQSEYYGKMCSTKGKPTVHCIGHTHIDIEWLWHRRQTREKMQRSFSNIKALMDRYPEMRFTLSQPELYRYLKEEAPEKYEELKALVKEGRWEPEGAMYVEADCNLISGESFVRQILYGKRFFRDEFGVDNKVLFLPDVFGYSAALPQILKKSGINYFVTSKISWNDTNKMPYDSFMWQGIDGSEIYTTFITAQDARKNHQSYNLTTYVGQISSPYVLGAWDRYQQKEYNKNVIITYGFGDGGGGPTKNMLERYRRLEKGLPGYPVAKMNFVLPCLDECKREFDENSEKLSRMPKWVGELYLEFHRGTYTSIAKNKRNNRQTELKMQRTEGVMYNDLLFGGDYDKPALDLLWRKTLHNQFHDIIPGSSIKEVYDGTDKDYAEIHGTLDRIFEDRISRIKSDISTEGGTFVYNPLGFACKGNVITEDGTVEIVDAVPAVGWSVVNVFDGNTVSVSGNTAENDFYRVVLDESGRIVSLFDKEACRETVLQGSYFNEFQAFEDYPFNYDAWELSEYYKSKKYVLDDNAEITQIVDGSRSGFRIRKHYMDSVIEQDMWLYSTVKRIDFDTRIDWHQKHQVLKVAFPIDVHANEAKYEIQYGYVARPTHSNTSWDEAKFEVCGHRWADMSENGFGFSLFNDCKYGFNAEGSVMKLTVLKSASYPYPAADEGEHVLSYAITTHNGSIAESNIVQQAHLFNQPMYASKIKKQEGSLGESFSLVSCDNKNVIIDTVKKAEDSSDMIVRLYETYNSRNTVKVSVAGDFKEAYLCDLMENQLEKLELNDGTVTVPVKNFEIVTVKFVR